jgi:hypothetical protein
MVFLVINTLFIQPDDDLPIYNVQATYLFFIGMSLSWYMNLLAHPPHTPLSQNVGFWLNTGSFFHHMLLFFRWIMLDAMIKQQLDEKWPKYWTYGATILFWVLITVSLVVDLRKSRNKIDYAR